MDISTLIGISSAFYKVADEVIESLGRQQVSHIEIETLRLKRAHLTTDFEDAQRRLAEEAELEKKNKVAELRSRGLGSSSLRTVAENEVERAATDELKRMREKFTFAMDQIALLERKARAQGQGWRSRLWSFVRFMQPRSASHH